MSNQIHKLIKIGIIFGIIILLSGFIYHYQKEELILKKQEALFAIPSVKAEYKEIIQTLVCNGEVACIQSVELKSEISGKIDKILVKPGAKVVKDQILIELDRGKLESQVNESLLSIESTRLQSEKIQQEIVRKKALYKQDLISKKEFEDTSIDSRIAENDYQLQKVRLKTLQQDLLKTSIRAPFDAEVLSLPVMVGAVVVGADGISAGTPLMYLGNVNSLEVKADVSEIDVTKLQSGLPVELSFYGIPGFHIIGNISYIYPYATLKGSDQEIRSFPIRIHFTTENPLVRPGMGVQVLIKIAEFKNILTLPLAAVFQEEGNSSVYVLNLEGKYEQRSVITGVHNANLIEIREGLKDTETVSLILPPEFLGK